MNLRIIFFTNVFTCRGINYPVSSVGGIAHTRQGLKSLANSASPLKWTGRLVFSPLEWTLAISQRFESPAACERCHWLCNFPANSQTPPKKVAEEQGSRGARENRQLSTTTPEIVEAQGWVINSNGQVELVAKVPTATPSSPTFTIQECNEP